MAAMAIATLILTSLLYGPRRPYTVSAQPGSRNAREGLPDPCEQSLIPPGNANGLHERCEAIGTGGGAAKGDFNGDGFADLAVGVPHEDVNGIGGEGAVNVIYGSATGLTATADQIFIEPDTTANVPGAGDHFGFSLAAGDFNGDGFSDLAVGTPDKNRGSATNAGAVFVINGSANGLDGSTMKSVLGLAVGRSGAALVWADFNADGFGDLAVGAPDAIVRFEDPLTCIDFGITVVAAGVVQVFYGSVDGLKATGSQLFHEGPIGCLQGDNPANVGFAANENDHFGSVLAAGNFHGGSAADLVVGIPFKDLPGTKDSGAVALVPGSSTKLKGSGSQQLSQDLEGVGGASENGDQFGRAVATGDFDGDGRDDLAVGVPFEDLDSNSKADAGAVQIFFGSRTQELVTTDGTMFISQTNLPGVSLEAGDRFGWALATGDFDADGKDDLAVGVPGEDLGAVRDAGLVEVLYGTSNGPSLTRVQNWSQDSTGVPDIAEVGDQFGYALSAWNYGRGSNTDLAIGVPFEDIVSAATGTEQVDAGAVNVIYGSFGGLRTDVNAPQFWHQDVPGIQDTAQSDDHFGEALY
jgi:hypothetical protein